MWVQLSLWNINICMLCSLSTPTSAEGGVEEDRRGVGEGEGKASCQKGWQTQQAESFLARASAWLGGAARAAACLRGDISLNKAEDRLGLGGLLGLFHLEGIAPPPPTLKTKERKERGCCFSWAVGQTAFQFHECGLYSCSLFGERYVIHNTKTLKHDLLNFAFGLLRVQKVGRQKLTHFQFTAWETLISLSQFIDVFFFSGFKHVAKYI